MIGPESRFRRRDRVLAQSAAEKRVLLDLDNGEYFALDEVGGRIWDLCDGAHRVSEMVAALGEEFDAPAATIESDVLELLQEMADEKLLLEEA